MVAETAHLSSFRLVPFNTKKVLCQGEQPKEVLQHWTKMDRERLTCLLGQTGLAFPLGGKSFSSGHRVEYRTVINIMIKLYSLLQA